MAEQSAAASSRPAPVKGQLQKAEWENKPFALGGTRVPKGMEDHANWMDLPEQAVVPTRGEDISPQYVALEAKRNAYGDLKKLLALVTPTVASIYKNSATLSNTSGEEKKAQIHALIAQEEKRRDEFVLKLKEFQEKDGLKPTQNDFGASLAKIVSTVPPSDCYEQDKHVAWNDEAKRLGQNLFREQNVFLQAMKAEKKKKQASS